MAEPAKKKATAEHVFPREYLLRTYNAAVQHGHIILHPISEDAAKSFTMQFYRLRRRSDTSNASFILPEFHLVTVGKWSPAQGGSLAVYYNTMPEGEALPHITPASGIDVEAEDVEPMRHDPLPAEELTPNFDVDDYVTNLIKSSRDG